jgi:hypothetical protein
MMYEVTIETTEEWVEAVSRLDYAIPYLVDSEDGIEIPAFTRVSLEA